MSHCIDFQNVVLGNNALFMQIIGNLSSKEMTKLFSLSKSFTMIYLLNISYDDLIYKIYKTLYLPLQIKNQLNFDILIKMTIRVIKLGHTLKYIHQQNTQFSGEEISIRNIIFDIVKFENITSLYYLLHMKEFYSLLNRFIVDEIVISPYECTHSNNIRKRLHYYGNEQTLRMALLRFQKYDMIRKILSDMKYISKKKNLDIFWFIWDNNNLLYEILYMENSNCLHLSKGYICLAIMINFINKENKQSIILSKDCNMRHSNDNYYNERYSYRTIGFMANDDDANANEEEYNIRIHDIKPNLLIFVLIKNINHLFSEGFKYCQKKFNTSDFYLFNGSISENGDLIYSQYGEIKISDRLLEYINIQEINLIDYVKKHLLYVEYFNKLAGSLNNGNIDFYSNSDAYYLTLDIILNHTDNIFIIIKILLYCFRNNFNINFIYNDVNFEYDNIPPAINYTLLEYVTRLIHKLYISSNELHANYLFSSKYQFKKLVNLLLIRKMLLDESYNTF